MIDADHAIRDGSNSTRRLSRSARDVERDIAMLDARVLPNPLDDALYSFRWAVYVDQEPRGTGVIYAKHVAEAHASLKQFILTQT